MSLYYDSGVLVKLYVREELSDAVARFLAERREAVAIDDLHEIEMRNALRLKRFREEMDDEQLAASMAMLANDLVARRLIRTAVDWQSVFAAADVRASGSSSSRADKTNSIEVRSATPLSRALPPREVSSEDEDERVADSRYAVTPKYAASHDVLAD